VVLELSESPEFPHAASTSPNATDAARIRFRMIPPGPDLQMGSEPNMSRRT
jgi:hypothetical protein